MTVSSIHRTQTGTTVAVCRSVRALMSWHGLTQAQLGRAMGLPQSAVSKRLAGGVAWNTDELDRLSAILRVAPADLVSGSVALLPHLDSNQEPAG